MVWTAQANCTGAPAAAEVQKLKVVRYRSIFWQHWMLNMGEEPYTLLVANVGVLALEYVINAYKIYSLALHKQYTPNQKCLLIKQCGKELTFDLLPEGRFNADAAGRTSQKHSQPFTNYWMDSWKEDSEQR